MKEAELISSKIHGIADKIWRVPFGPDCYGNSHN